ncbi:MAG: hypothetical protein WCH93_02555 [Actinomycetota bacterium]
MPEILFVLNGTAVVLTDDGCSLLEGLRDRLGVRSAKNGCSPQGQCGCCTREWPEVGRFVGKASTNISWALWRTRHLTAAGAVRAFPGELARRLGQRSAWSLPVPVLRRLGRVRLRP